LGTFHFFDFIGRHGVTDREDEWREGYEAGYEAGKQEREENN